MLKKKEPTASKPKQYKLFIFYEAEGILIPLDEKIEKAVGQGAFSTGILLIKPHTRDMLFLMNSFDEAMAAAKRVGELAKKIKRLIKFNIL